MAGIIDEGIIEEVKERADIVDIISRYTELKKKGSSYMGLCPFHNEKTPSFSVVPDKGFFNCFGCGEKGDVISFVMKKENLSFTEAVAQLCEEYNIPLNKPTEAQQKKQKFRKKIYAMNREAALYYMHLLSRHRHGLNYLNGRGITPDIIKKFGLGFSPAGGDQLLRHMTKLGYSNKDLLKANLVNYNNKRDQYYDRFRNRIMFPIIDSRSRVIGFGGRVLDDSMPKYLNTSDTLVFHKGSHLFGLNILSKESSREKIILVEGYMDVISLYKSGINYSTASLGTALTREQARLIKRYGKEVYICYDGDEAGIRATKRAIEVLAQENIRPKIIILKDNLDPDDFISKYGVLEFEAMQKKADSALDFRIKETERNFNLSSTESLTRFLEKVAQILANVQSPVEQEIYMDRVANNYGISKESLRLEIGRAQPQKKYNRPDVKLNKDINHKTEKKDTRFLQLISYALESEDFFIQIYKGFQKFEYKKRQWNLIMEALVKIYQEQIATREEREQWLTESVPDLLDNTDIVKFQNVNLTDGEEIIDELMESIVRSQLESKSEVLIGRINALERKSNRSVEEDKRLKESLQTLSQIALRLREPDKGG